MIKATQIHTFSPKTKQDLFIRSLSNLKLDFCESICYINFTGLNQEQGV